MSADPTPGRDLIVRRLAEDLAGPRSADEILADRPTDTYLTGMLWPQRTAMAGEDDDSLVAGAAAETGGEETEASAVPAASAQKPSAAGISFCLAKTGEPAVNVRCAFARYVVADADTAGAPGGDPDAPAAPAAGRRSRAWRRVPVEATFDGLVLAPGSRSIALDTVEPAAGGARLHVRCIDGGDRWLATVTLVNDTPAGEGREALELATMFQTSIGIGPAAGTRLVPRPAVRGIPDPEAHSDERSTALLFRDAHAFASGHGCSATWEAAADDGGGPSAARISTTWLPSAIVPAVSASGHGAFDRLRPGQGADALSARALAEATPAELGAALDALCDCYADWIGIQRATKLPGVGDRHRPAAEANLAACDAVLARMRDAAAAVTTDPDLREAFQFANHAMHVQHGWDPDKAARGELRWRPFQLAFLLLAAPSSAIAGHPDREVMDLLWFPTGGGKTEAYLALVALVGAHRRLTGRGSGGGGVASVMRYTLRLLTTQQFARSAAVVLACEAMRDGRIPSPHAARLRGSPAFSVGLWVGGDASPNTLAQAWASINGATELASPRQLAKCPCCRGPVAWTQSNVTSPVLAACTTAGCTLEGRLPVWTVDEDVYRERPTLVIGTVDKFAQIVRKTETNRLFGIAAGSPPDLVIQDELHLISGPLGTVSGTYEAAFDLLFSTGGAKPKVIGSTATIRRAAEQIRDLFDRGACQFPPPGVDQSDSGFAVATVPGPGSPGRRYVGVTTAGRSAKFTLQSVAASLLQSAAGAFAGDEARDPYFTLVGYFNSLRELGGALVLMQDDVEDAIALYAGARFEEARPMREVEELTSRRTQEEVLRMLETLEIRAGGAGAVDAVLATNMVSVGVDIPRLGLMVVNGQPKTIAEYIQSTSRVGRGEVSGLVVTVLNNGKARDRSRYETFESWHGSIYRDVEATSVTPFASRARDRALHAALVAAVRHLVPGMLDRPDVDAAARVRADAIIDSIVERANRIDPEETAVRAELEDRLDRWVARQPSSYWNDYKERESLLQSAERAAWKKALGREAGKAWPTLNSMRTVEADTPFRMAPALRARGD